jgi:carbonic anhydrase/SulP family sulfate permease
VAHQVQVSFLGFQDKYGPEDNTRYIEHSTRELQTLLTPEDVLEILREGNLRFHAGKRLSRNIQQQVSETSHGQYPFACVLSCIDSRAPVETIFDLGLGDIFSIRVAGNITSGEVLGSIEYACSVAGAKLVLVLGHTKCGAVTAATNAQQVPQPAPTPVGEHLHYILDEIRHSIAAPAATQPADEAYIEAIAVRNVRYSTQQILQQSPAIHDLVNSGRVAVVGAMYDVSSGLVEFYTQEAAGLDSQFAERFASRQPPV